MRRSIRLVALGLLTLAIFLIGSFVSAAPAPKELPPYDPELFAFPSKVTPDDKQKEKLAELRTKYEPMILEMVKTEVRLQNDKSAWFAAISTSASKRQLMRAITREKNAILTEQQREAAGIKTIIPVYATEKGLHDDKVWDLGQLEKVFVIQSRSYDPEEMVVAFVVITKQRLTADERRIDAENWTGRSTNQEGLIPSKVQVVFYNKSEETIARLDAAAWFRGLTRTETKLTDKEVEAGLLRYRIKIDLADQWGALKDAATVKLVYPELK
jgi:hypothetical protein